MTDPDLELVAWSDLYNKTFEELARSERRVGELRSQLAVIQRKLLELRDAHNEQ